MKKETILEIIGYISLAMCVVGNLTVGYFYAFAEWLFLISNTISTIRSFALKQPNADKIRNITFLGMTIALLILFYN